MCVPSMSGDSATFDIVPTGDPTLSIPETITTLIFNNMAHYTIAGAPNSLTFAGATSTIHDQLGTHTISAPISLDTTALTITIDNMANTLTLSGGVTEVGASSITVKGLGALTNLENIISITGNIDINPTAVVDAATVNSINTTTTPDGCTISLAMGNFHVFRGTVNNLNQNAMPIVGAGYGAQILTGSGDIILDGGILNNENTGDIQMMATGGAVASPAGSFTLNNTAVVVSSNSGGISTTGGSGLGGLGTVIGATTIDLHGTSSLTSTNTGTVDNTPGGKNFGTVIAANICTIDSGTTLTNNSSMGTITDAVGSLLSVPDSFPNLGMLTVNGSLINENSATLAGINGAVGAQAAGLPALPMGPPAAPITSVVIDGGTFTNSNTSNISALVNNGIGAMVFATDVSIINNGSLVSANSGTITSPGGPGGTNRGADLHISTLTQTKGSVALTNTGDVTNAQAFGGHCVVDQPSQILEGTFDIINGTTMVTPTVDQFGAAGVNLQTVLGLTIGGGASAAVLNLKNYGQVTNGALGCAMTVGDQMSLIPSFLTVATNGKINLTNFANLGMNGPSVVMAMFNAPIQVQSGGVININLSPPGFVTPGFPACGITGVDIDVLSGGKYVNNDATLSITFTNHLGGLVGGVGTFRGITMGPATFSNSGTLVPGPDVATFPEELLANPGPHSPPGIMNIFGGFTQTGTGTLIINILNAAPGGFSQVNVAGMPGTASIAGTLSVFLNPGFVINDADVITVVQTTGGRTGMFTTFDFSTFPPNIVPTIHYSDPNSVFLTFAVGPTPPPPPPPPPSVCPILTSFIGGFAQPIFASITHINTQIDREMQRLRGRFLANCETPNTVSGRRVSQQRYSVAMPSNRSIATPVVNKSTIALAENKSDDLAFLQWKPSEQSLELDRVAACQENLHPWNFYFGPMGSIGDANNHGNQIGYDYWTAGGLVGFDYAFSQAGVGMLAYYERTEAHVDRHWGNFNADQAHASFYTTVAPKNVLELAFNGIVGGGYEWYTIDRKVSGQTAKGDSRGSQVDALAGVEYTFSHRKFSSMPEKLQIIPMLDVQYIYLAINKYREHGAGLNNLRIKDQHVKSLSTILGTWVNYTWDWTNVALSLEGNVAWQQEYANKQRSLHYSAVNASAFGAGCPLGLASSGQAKTAKLRLGAAKRSTLLAGLDLLCKLYNRFGIEASYDLEYNSLFRSHYFYLGFNAEF